MYEYQQARYFLSDFYEIENSCKDKYKKPGEFNLNILNYYHCNNLLKITSSCLNDFHLIEENKEKITNHIKNIITNYDKKGLILYEFFTKLERESKRINKLNSLRSTSR